MIECPFCGHENIEGVDSCAECGVSLSGLSIPAPKTDIERSVLRDPIAALGPREPLQVEADAPVSMVLKLLVAHRVGCAIVMNKGQAVGIFTERDAMIRLGPRAKELGAEPISRFMTPNPEMLDVDNKIAFALQRMDAGGFRHIPILDGGVIIGIVSVRDVLRYVSDKLVAAETA